MWQKSSDPSLWTLRATSLPRIKQWAAAALNTNSFHVVDAARGGGAQDTMPNHVSFSCVVGTCVFYDNRIFHTALPNTSAKDQCCLIASYKQAASARSVSGQVIASAARLERGTRGGRDELRQLARY